MGSPAPTRRGREPYDDRWQVSPRRADGSRGRHGPHLGSLRLTPTRLTLGVAFVGSTLFVLYAVTLREIPMLAASALVMSLVLAAFAVAGAVATYRAASDGRAAAAFAGALFGGVMAVMAFGCIAVAVILSLIWRPPAA
jgi:hypothetical protein